MFRLLPYGTIRKNCLRSHRRQSDYSDTLNYNQECRVKAYIALFRYLQDKQNFRDFQIFERLFR